MDVEHHLSDEERIKVQMQVDHFLTVIETRYGISVNEATELLRWARAQRERNSKLAQAGAISLIGLIVTALAMSAVEGIKSWLNHR
jgi:hypothetical protein